jgi:hypothetical protein
MLKKVLIGVGVVVALFLVVVAVQPATYRVERTVAMTAPANVVFAEINDLNRHGAWSPWEKMDPKMEKKVEGPAGGVGQVSSWKGNSQVGTGKQTITESVQNDHINMKLEFMEPMQSEAMSGFAFKGSGDTTNVTWWMEGNNNFLGKAAGLFMDMDAMIGTQFEKGLADLKTISEANAKAAAMAAAAPVDAAAAVAPAAAAPTK